MSYDFANLAAREINPSEIKGYTINEIDGAPTLYGRCAGEKNVAFKKARLALNAKTRASRQDMTVDQIRASARKHARKLFPETVLTGWEDVVDANGDTVEFSVEAAEAFLSALPDWIIDPLIEYFVSPANFAGELSREEVDAVAGN